MMNLTKWQLDHDAAWKRVFRALAYLVSCYGTAEIPAQHILGDAVRAIRAEPEPEPKRMTAPERMASR